MSYTKISFFHFPNKASKWWAFKQMQLAHDNLTRVSGLDFYRLMGSGAGEGFSIKPDWSVYTLLQVWDKKESAINFNQSSWYQDLLNQIDGEWHFDLSPYHSKGTWKGEKPFELAKPKDHNLMAVITRARIKWTHLLPFWFSVPAVSKVISKQKSLLFQKGIGEWPLIEQATFSIWNREQAMKEFAYHQAEHRKVVQKTRKLKWYKEEQFTRFAVLNHSGSWPNSTFENLPKTL